MERMVRETCRLGRRTRVARWPLGAALAAGVCAGMGGGLADDDRSTPSPVPEAQTSWACKAGPGIPIASGHLYTLDILTGAETDLGVPASNGVSVAWDPATNRLLGFNIATGLWDLTTMPGTLIGKPAVMGAGGSGLSRDPSTDKWYVLTEGSSDCGLYEINVGTAAATFIGYMYGVSVSNLAINAAGEAYATDVDGWRNLYRVNLATGELTIVAPLSVPGLTSSHTSGICFDPSGTLWLISGGTADQPTRLFTVDTTTGVATFQRNVQSSGWYGGLAIR